MHAGSWQHRSYLMLAVRCRGLVERSKLTRAPRAHQVKAVVQVLLNRSDIRGLAWPSLPSIARDSELSRPTVARCIALLIEAGAITRDGKVGRGTRYRLDWAVLDGLCDAPPWEAHTCDAPPGAPDAPPGARNAPPLGCANSKRNILNRGKLRNLETIAARTLREKLTDDPSNPRLSFAQAIQLFGEQIKANAR